MNIGFVNFTPLVYTVETPFEKPLGGSESALCYLSLFLARLGHKVKLFCRVDKPKIIKKVFHFPVNKIFSKEALSNLDFLIVQNTPKYALELKQYLSPKTKLIFWSEHAFNQPDVSCLKNPEYRNLYDFFIFISLWQAEGFLNFFGLDKNRCFILRNAAAPFFIEKKIDLNEKKEPILVYTSTPFRGLDILLEAFPLIKKKIGEAKLWIFSSMKVYQQNDHQFESLYQKAGSIEGVKYFGSVSQSLLAEKLSKASIFAYPNIFPETSCIAAMEAMALGLQIVTSNLGALPETTAGFAKLIDIGQDRNLYKEKFVEEVIDCIKNQNSKETQMKLIRQMSLAKTFYNWELRAWEWEEVLKQIK